MFRQHLRFPILAVSTTHREVGVACIGHDLELVDGYVRELRHHRRLPAREAAVGRIVKAILHEHDVRAVVIDVHDRAISADGARVIALVRRLAEANQCPVLSATFAEAVTALGTPDRRACIALLAERHPRLRARLWLCPRDRPRMTRLGNVRPLVVAVALAHAAGLVSLSAEATELSMPT